MSIFQSAVRAYFAALLAPSIQAMGSAYTKMSAGVTTALNNLTTQLANKADKSSLFLLPNGRVVTAIDNVAAATFAADLQSGYGQIISIDRSDLRLDKPLMPVGLTTGALSLMLHTTQASCAITLGTGVTSLTKPTTINAGEMWLCTFYIYNSTTTYAEFKRLG